MPHTLLSLVTVELAAPVDPRAAAMAGALAAQYPAASRAVLFYGSCLREKNLDGLMLDFYLIVSDYRAAYGKRWLATANRLIPPNVFTLGNKDRKSAVRGHRVSVRVDYGGRRIIKEKKKDTADQQSVSVCQQI